MQIHHLALILAGLAGVLLVLLVKIAATTLQRRRGAGASLGTGALPAAKAPATDIAVDEPVRQRNRQIVPASVREAATLAEAAEPEPEPEIEQPMEAPRGYYAAVEARLATLFESYEAGETSIADYAEAVRAEASLVDAHEADLAAREAGGDICGPEANEVRQETGMAREAIAWCLDWAEAEQERTPSPIDAADDAAGPALSAAA